MLRYIFSLISLLLIIPTFAARKDTTIHLGGVTVTGDHHTTERIVGTKLTKIKTVVIQNNQTRSLAELLTENSSLYIKSLGQGALSTSSFRGTSSNHTLVNWNGININSPMLGNFDFSQIPTFFTDEISLHHGSGHNDGGSGALGGSINLGNQFLQDTTIRTHLLAEYGANNTITGGGAIQWGKKGFASKTRVYYQKSDNNYLYLNTEYSKDPILERRKHAEYDQLGLMQEFFYTIDTKQRIRATAWWQHDDRNLPPAIFIQNTPLETQQTDDIRAFVEYQYAHKAHRFQLSTIFLNNHYEYEKRFDHTPTTLTQNKIYSYLVKGSYEYNLSEKWRFKDDIEYRFDRVLSSAYAGNSYQEPHFHNNLGIQYNPTSRLKTQLQWMVESNDNDWANTYNIGASYMLINQHLWVKANQAYNYRYPTLNERFWNPGGNPDLRPEKGWSADATITFNYERPQWGFKVEPTFFWMNIKDWITWLPRKHSAIWEARNFNTVRSLGAELMTEGYFYWGNTQHEAAFNYTFTQSQNRPMDSMDDYYQLPYVPRNNWNARYTFTFKGIRFNYRMHFTDVRYTSEDQSYFTPAYLIHDFDLSYRFSWKKITFIPKVTVDNLLDTYYESTEYYPMPLRSWRASLQVRF